MICSPLTTSSHVPNVSTDVHALPINDISVEDLEYVERDLGFHELVSLGFLLYGHDRANAEFVLQKLLVMANSYGGSKSNSNLLLNYAIANPQHWRWCLIEALTIVGSWRVLRKLGFRQQILQQHLLPHIAELSLHIHPLLKALYKMADRMSPVEAGRLVLHINEEHKESGEHLRFYNFDCLEMYLLDWLTRRIICIGDDNLNGANLDVLISYFKLNEMDALKMLLATTIQSNTATIESKENHSEDNNVDCSEQDSAVASVHSPPSLSTKEQVESGDCYTVRHDQAGIVLIINQEAFHQEEDVALQHLLPKKPITKRHGTDTDKNRLKEVFSSFHYTVEEHNNLTHIEMLHCIREIVKRSLLFDSLIVCILTHGSQGIVYGSNSIPVEIAEIERIITGETLQGKPKMLVIQACQTMDTPLSLASDRQKYSPAADAYADMIKAMSTVPGYTSWRHTQSGSWFIQTLCDQLDKLGDRRHILDILISVTKEVTNKRGDRNELMVPITSHTLRKYFFLPPRDGKHLSDD